MYAERAHSHKVEIEGASHAVYESHPKEVAALIEDAAQHAANQNLQLTHNTNQK
jgi:pimeloyl-ACP methyl ester carboxylesterase